MPGVRELEEPLLTTPLPILLAVTDVLTNVVDELGDHQAEELMLQAQQKMLEIREVEIVKAASVEKLVASDQRSKAAGAS